jgi:hypothetical protein
MLERLVKQKQDESAAANGNSVTTSRGASYNNKT